MASLRKPDKTSERYPFGPRPLSALLVACTRRAFRHRSPVAQRLLIDWPVVVGPAIAAMATPERLSRGVLTLVCDGPSALELQHGAPRLIERINSYFGGTLVTELSLHQTLTPVRPAAVRPDPPHPSIIAEIPEKLADLPDGELRVALARLGETLAVAKRRRRI